jgi:exopolysaccharide/PEP-CTERM locus tyrosine autokinase
MSKHSPIAPGPEEEGRPRAPRRPSLVERAANVHDFTAAFRGGGRPVASVPVEDLAPLEPSLVGPSLAGPSLAGAPIADPPRIDIAYPEPQGRMGSVSLDGLRDGGFIVPGSPANALSEEFRVIKRQLLQTAGEVDNGRTVLICSARPDEGKTFCAVNLALSIAAEMDREVILIDADVAKPEILSTLGLESGPGLLDAIADASIDVESCLIHTDVPHLSVLPAGRHTNEATELLASARTLAVLARLRERDERRVIIFDSPPALAASPAGVLAMHCGQALFVVRADRTAESDMREALELLSACPKPQLLLNGVEFNANNRRFGTYYGVEG